MEKPGLHGLDSSMEKCQHSRNSVCLFYTVEQGYYIQIDKNQAYYGEKATADISACTAGSEEGFAILLSLI